MRDLRVLLIAEEAAGSRVLRLLRSAPSVTVEAVLASPERAEEMGSVWSVATRAGLPTIPAERVKEAALAEEIADRRVDLILNVHSLYLVHPTLLEAPPLGAYNLHPGPLPEMAGLNVPSWAILLGHQEHAVTVHRMTERVDEGTIAYVDRFPIPPDATGLSLSLECVRRGVPLVARLIETVARGDEVPAHEQDHSRRRYFGRHAPNGGAIDFARPNTDVEAHVRAASYRPFHSPWGHPRARGRQGVIEVTEARAVMIDDPNHLPPPGTVRHRDGIVLVACADGWIRMDDVLLNGEPSDASRALSDGEMLDFVPQPPSS